MTEIPRNNNQPGGKVMITLYWDGKKRKDLPYCSGNPLPATEIGKIIEQEDRGRGVWILRGANEIGG